jgi:sulfur-oxidizing protein SoxZ
MSSITLRTKPLDGKILVRILIEHPMETGRRLDETTGKPLPAHFITELTVALNGQPMVRGLLSTGVSRNPYFSFKLISAKPGDRIKVAWLDNRGQNDSVEVLINPLTAQ